MPIENERKFVLKDDGALEARLAHGPGVTQSFLRQAYLDEKQRAVGAAPDSRARYNEQKQAFIDAAKARLRW